MYKPVVKLVREGNISNHSFNWPRVCHIHTLDHNQMTNMFDKGFDSESSFDKGFDPESSKV